MSYNGKVYRKQGGDELVVNAGGKITAAGTQASTIANLTITANLAGTACHTTHGRETGISWRRTATS